jgi:glutamate formiminotransferase
VRQVPALTLLAIPNVSEARDTGTITAIGHAFTAAGTASLLDVHRDEDHNRSVFTLAGRPGSLAEAVLQGARQAVERIDVTAHAGVHPFVGALDVAPIVHLDAERRGAACAEALVLADLLGTHLDLPVFLYGALTQNKRTRVDIRRGGPNALRARIDAGELVPDFGPHHLHPTAGAVLVAARPPLVAWNVELAPPATLEQARRIAALIRESGPEGLPGLRAIGLYLERQGIVQISMNVEDPIATPLAATIDAIARHAQIAAAELVGTAPRVAFAGFPGDIPIRGFDADRQVVENALERLSS